MITLDGVMQIPVDLERRCIRGFKYGVAGLHHGGYSRWCKRAGNKPADCLSFGRENV